MTQFCGSKAELGVRLVIEWDLPRPRPSWLGLSVRMKVQGWQEAERSKAQTIGPSRLGGQDSWGQAGKKPETPEAGLWREGITRESGLQKGKPERGAWRGLEISQTELKMGGERCY